MSTKNHSNFMLSKILLAIISSGMVCSSLANTDFSQQEIVVVDEQTQSRPVVNEDGQKLYLIILDEEVARNESSQGELPARNSMAAENARDIYGWHKPNVRALVKRFEREYGIKAQTMTSYTLPSFSAFLSDEVAQEVSADPRVARMVMTYDDGVVFSAWADGGSQNAEIIPWGKIAIGTNDNLTTGNVVYMVDGGR